MTHQIELTPESPESAVLQFQPSDLKGARLAIQLTPRDHADGRLSVWGSLSQLHTMDRLSSLDPDQITFLDPVPRIQIKADGICHGTWIATAMLI